MSLNVGKCAYANTARIHSIMVYLNPGDTAAPWVCLRAKGTVPYLGLRLDPRGMVTMKEKHVLRCEALLGWCKNTLGPASVPHEVMAQGWYHTVRVPFGIDTIQYSGVLYGIA